MFVCLGTETENIKYLRSHPELNIVVCALTDNFDLNYDILRRLFKDSIEEIATDDTRFYPDSYTTFTILKKNGFVRNFFIGIALGSLSYNYPRTKDEGFGKPNFLYNSENKQLTKISNIFTPITKFIDQKLSPEENKQLNFAWNIFDSAIHSGINEDIAFKIGYLAVELAKDKKLYDEYLKITMRSKSSRYDFSLVMNLMIKSENNRLQEIAKNFINKLK